MATKKYEIVLEGVKAAATLKDLKEGTEQLKQELETLDVGSKEFDRLAREIQKAESKVKDIERTYEAADLEGRFGRLGDVLGGVARGAGAVQGALYLMGESGEEAEEVMANLMAAMAIADSVEGFAKLASAVQKFGSVTKIATAIQAAFNVVLNLNPIGLIVAAIALLVGGIILLNDKVKQGIEWFRGLSDEAKIVVAILGGPLVAVIWAVDAALTALGVTESKEEIAARKREEARVARHKVRMAQIEEEIDALDAQIAAYDDATKEITKRYDHEIALANAAGKDVTTIEASKLEALRASLQEQLRLVEQRYAKERELQEEFLKAYDKGNNDVLKNKIAQLDKENKAAVDSKKDELKTVENQIEIHEAKVTKAATDAAKNRAKELKDLRQKEWEDRQKEQEELRKWFEEQQKKEEDARLAALKNEQEIDDFMRKMADERSKLDLEEDEKRLAKDKEDRDKIKEQAELEAAAMAQRIELTQSGLGTLNDLVQAFAGKSEKAQKAAFEFNKAISIAQTIIETYKAAQSAYASQMTIPTPDAPVRAAIAAGIAIASGLARVAAIARTRFNTTTASGGGGSGGSGGGGVVQEPPRLANVSGTTIDANRDQLQDMRVKVVESDIKGVSNRVNVIESQANIR